MAIWNRNKVPPANLNAGQQYNAEDWTSEQTFNVANNNAFYAVDYAEALGDTPDTSQVGNIGTPTVTLIDNVKTIDGVEKTFKKFKFANLKGEKGDAGINDALVVQTFGTSTEDAISQKVITDKFDELDEQLNSVPISDTSYGLIEAFENAETAVMQNLLLHGLTVTQLAANGNFNGNYTGWTARNIGTPSVADNTCSFTATATYGELEQSNINYITGHTYYVSAWVYSDSSSVAMTCFNLGTRYKTVAHGGAGWELLSWVGQTVDDAYSDIFSIRDNRTSGWTQVKVKDVIKIDLTTHNIASYDLATCQSKFPSYFDGTISVDKGEVSVIGKNLFDGIWEGGYFSTVNGTNLPNSAYIRTKNYIMISPSTQYVISHEGVGLAPGFDRQYVFYDDNKAFISPVTGTYGQFTTPANARYVKVSTNASTSLQYTMQIEKGATITTYTPYNPTRSRYPKLQSVPAIQDTYNVLSGLHTQNVQSVATTSGTAINTTNYPLAKNAVGFVIALTAGGTQTGTVGTDTASGDGTLYYQLNVPVLTYYPPKSIPLEVNSSIIHQSIMSDIAFYATEITISDSDYPISTLQEVFKVNVDTGAETPIDIATCTVASGGLTFTSTALTDGDLVWFRYEHTLDSATPTTEYTYTTSLSGGLATIQQDVKKQNESLQKQIDELRTVIQSLSI